MKVLQEPGNKQLVQKMELEHIADRRLPAAKQQYRDIEDDLLFVLDEKGHSVHLTDARRRVHVAERARRRSCCRTSRRQCIASITTTMLTAEQKIEERRKSRSSTPRSRSG